MRTVRYLLVNDRDGRVLAELASVEQALRLLERIGRRRPALAAGVSLVRFSESQGSVVGTSTSASLRVLPELPGAPGVADLRR